MAKKVKKSKSVDKKKEKLISEALKKDITAEKKIESNLESQLAKTNIGDNGFVESLRSSGADANPSLRRVQRAEALEDELPAVNRQETGRNTEGINYTADRTGYTGEEYRANLQRQQERVIDAQTARKVQPLRQMNSGDLLSGDPRIVEQRRPTVLDRTGDGRTIQIDEDYRKYESKLPFEKDGKKYKHKL